MAIKVGGIEVVDNNRQLKNINSVDSGSVNVLNSALNTDPTRATLTKTFTNGETASITLNQNVSTAPVVSVVKEVPQTGFSSKGAWDVNATASNYDLYDYAPNTTLTPTSTASLGAINTSTIQGSHLGVSGIFTNGRGVRLSPDGTKAYVINEHRSGGQNTIRQWTLSTAFDTSTASNAVNFAETAGEQYARGFDFNGDGTKLYIIGYNNYQLQEYSLSTAYDVTTATATSTTFTPSPQPGTPTFFTFGNSGYKMYITSTGGNAYLHQYTLSTAYDITSVTNTQTISNPNGAGGGSRGIQFSDDGLTMFNLSQQSNWFIYQNTLSTAWDITSTVTQTHTLGISTNANNPFGLYIKDEHIYTFDIGGPHALYYKRTSTNIKSLTLGTGSFTADNVGMRIQGNGGDVRLADTAGNYTIPSGNSDFTDNSTIAAGSWTMHGLAPVANGLTLPDSEVTAQGWTSNFRVAAYSDYFSHTSSISTPVGLHMARDGSHFYICRQSGGIGIYSMATAFEPSSMNAYRGIWTAPGSTQSQQDIEFNEDGTRCYINDVYNGNEAVQVWSVSTAWRPDQGATLLSTINLTQSVTNNAPTTGGSIQFSNDGYKFYYLPYAYKSGNNSAGTTGRVGQTFPSPVGDNAGALLQYTLTTAYDLSTATYNGFTRVPHYSYSSFGITEDGKWLVNGGYNTQYVAYYPIPNAWDVTSIDASTEVYIDYDTYNRGGTQDGQIASSWVGDNYYVTSYNNNEVIKLPWGPVEGETTSPVVTDGYQVAVTNASGQIDSASWVDINSMTADQSLGNGEAYYAVSTDDRTTWSIAKGSDGVRPIVRDNAGTWQYNSNQGTLNAYNIVSPTFVQDTGSVIGNAGADPTGIFFKPDGTKMYVSNNDGNRVNDFVLNPAWDVSTATADTHGGILSTHSQDQIPQGVQLKSDGTKAYVVGVGTNALYQYTLTNAWDVYPSSYDSVSFSFASQDTTCTDIFFKPDGTQLFLAGGSNDRVFAYSLSTAWDLSTMSYSNVSFDISSYETGIRGLTFSSDGTQMFTVGTGHINEWSLSTAWDISTASYTRTYDASAESSTEEGIAFKPDGTKMYVVCADNNDQKVNEYTTGEYVYGTSTTWTNATTNDEFYALQQALGYNAFNRMDKTQLDAVADGSHFTLGDTLDLMIALKQTTDILPAPTSDGVSINYDAEALQQGAILGTDYDYQFPNSTTVELTSNAAQNLKIRVV